MESWGFWIFLSVFVICDCWVFLSSHESFFQTHESDVEKRLCKRKHGDPYEEHY